MIFANRINRSYRPGSRRIHKIADERACGNRACTCNEVPDTGYCCEQCELAHEREKAGGEALEACQCGHSDCGNIPAVTVETLGLMAGQGVLA